MKRGIFIALSIILFLMPIVAAGISITGLDSLYNLGDVISANITLSSSIDTADFLTALIICNQTQTEIHKSIQTLSSQEKTIPIEILLGNSIIGNITGDCFIKAIYENGEATSHFFKITNAVSVEINVEAASYKPGDIINVSGKAFKKNGLPINGFVEIHIEGINLSIFNGIQQGLFTSSFKLPDNAPPRIFRLIAEVYDQDKNGAQLNYGVSSTAIRIKQVIKDIGIAFNRDSIVPGEQLLYTLILYDQAGNQGIGEGEISIYSPYNVLLTTKLVNAKELNSIKIETNFTPGYWKINAKYEGIEKNKNFLVEELEKAAYILNGNELYIKNIGNVPFSKPVEITIGDVSEIKAINLGLGELKAFKLSAPDGEYGIGIKEGGKLNTLGSALLTGRAISVGELPGLLESNYFTILWTFVILILLVIIVIIIRKIRRRTGRAFSKPIIPISRPNVSEKLSQTNIIDSGRKEEVSIVSLKIKNLAQLQQTSGPALQTIDNALLQAKTIGAKIYVDKDYRLIIFSPTITKEKENVINAIKIAKEIDDLFNNFNNSSAIKIEYGISVHTGDLIIESKDNTIKFVSLGNTLAIAKRISEIANFEVLLSETVHAKTIGKIKVEKFQDTSYWRLKKISEREAYSDFINRFVDRQKNRSK